MSKANPTAREKALKELGPDSQAIVTILAALSEAPEEEQKKFEESCIINVYPKKKQYIMLPNGHQQMKAIKDRKTGEYKQVPDFEMIEDRSVPPKKDINMGKAKTWYLNYKNIAKAKEVTTRKKSNFDLYQETIKAAKNK